MVEEKKDKVYWLGMDGLLVGGFFAIVAIIYFAIIYKSDLIIGYIVPFVVLAIVTLVFFNYLLNVYKFIKMAGKPKE